MGLLVLFMVELSFNVKYCRDNRICVTSEIVEDSMVKDLHLLRGLASFPINQFDVIL